MSLIPQPITADLSESISHQMLRGVGAAAVDFGRSQLEPAGDYPDFVVPLALAIVSGQVNRGAAICGNSVRVHRR